MCDASLYLEFHLGEITSVFVWFDRWRQLLTKQKNCARRLGVSAFVVCCLSALVM